MTTGTLPDGVRAYLEAVRAGLDDLPAEEREDLLADVEPSVLESAGDTDAPVEARLGAPERFADELRAAAGLPPRRPAPAPEAAPRPPLGQRLAEHPLVQALSGPARELAPIWWVLRGGVAAVLLAQVLGLFGSTLAALAVLGAAVSVAIGLRRPARTSIGVAANVVLALAALPAAAVALDDVRGDAVVSYSEPVAVAGLSLDGRPLDNVYAYDRAGRLLYDVRLFDATGRPLDIGSGDPDPARRVPRTRSGAAAFNAFPIRYFDPGTTSVANPSAGSPPAPEPLAGAPLVRQPEPSARTPRPKRRARGG